MVDYIVFGEVDSRDYGVAVFHTDSVYESAKREYKSIQIPGRNGDLILDGNRFGNVSVLYQCIVGSRFSEQVKEFINALFAVKGYAELHDSFNSDEFRMAAYNGAFSTDKVAPDGEIGSFTLKFDCKPQRFLTSGDTPTTFTGSDTLSNPTTMVSLPRIVVTGTNGQNMSGTFSVNGTAVVIDGAPTDVLTVDSDLMSVYNGFDNMNAYASAEFPVLDPGENSIVMDAGIGNITSIMIYPRWWRL